MSRTNTWHILVLIALALAGVVATDDLNGGNWPIPPYWTTNPTNQQNVALLQNQTSSIPFGHGGHTQALGWPNTFGYNPFRQPNPFGFAMPPTPMLYGGTGGTNMMGAQHIVPVDTAPITGGVESMSLNPTANGLPPPVLEPGVLTPTQTKPGPSSCRDTTPWGFADVTHFPQYINDDHQSPHQQYNVSLEWDRDRSRNETTDDEDDELSRGDRKGKKRASARDMERMQALDDFRAECALIPQHVLDLQRLNALHDQMSLMVELQCRCSELEKMLSKRQLSPGEARGHSPKRFRDGRGYPDGTDCLRIEIMAEGASMPIADGTIEDGWYSFCQRRIAMTNGWIPTMTVLRSTTDTPDGGSSEDKDEEASIARTSVQQARLPRFVYNQHTNTMYMDREAVDAARAMSDGTDIPVPVDNKLQPNPQGFPMNIREVQDCIHVVLGRRHQWQPTLHLLCEFLRTGSLAGGAGVVVPTNGTLDDWCQYAAHHLRAGSLNPTSGLIMDTSNRVSFASIWGMVMLHFLHPANAKNYYVRYFTGIMFRPRYYVDFIQDWNRECTNELPISIAVGSPVLRRMIFNGAGENLSELDVIQHLASCMITQEMLDNTYSWALVWIDQHTNSHFHDHYN
ncbi:hypothetical protein ARMGADRAFT_1027056 [Armillaria gallica]|uniref:Uncharacterized protein n=1 Tax=Armillaria gallica TaxID=47427 RepID=A0A2H3DUL5_ARMGA|nr:hypothetical protein ARMGADRAFT_1027056 [Armillaria gallica]